MFDDGTHRRPDPWIFWKCGEVSTYPILKLLDTVSEAQITSGGILKMHQFSSAQKQPTIIVVVVAHSYEAQIHTPGTQNISIIYYLRATCNAGTLVNFHGMLTISQGILHRVHEITFLHGAKLFPL